MSITTVIQHHARCSRCGRIAVAVPTPGIASPNCGCTGCGSVDYRLATPEQVEAVPHGSTMTVVEVPMTWQAEARRAVLLAKPMFVQREDPDCAYSMPAGWLTMVEWLIEGIEQLPGADAAQVVQIKAKLGEIRIFGDLPEGAGQFTQAAMAESRQTCEWCGDHHGQQVDVDGWRSTLCQRHQAIAPLIRNSVDHDNWRQWLSLPKDLPARPDLNGTWAALAKGADQLKLLGLEAIGISVPGDQWALEPVGVSVWTRAGADAAEVWPAALAAVHHLLDGWPTRALESSACQRWMRLDDKVERRRAALAGHPLMATGGKVKLGHPNWLPILERLLADLAAAGVPDGRIKAIRPAADGRLSVHPTLRGEAGKLVLEAADRAADGGDECVPTP